MGTNYLISFGCGSNELLRQLMVGGSRLDAEQQKSFYLIKAEY